MSPGEIVLVLLAGLWAGTINTIVGSGSLVSFPMLLAIGLPPVTANITNTVGVIPGSLSGAWGYRRELRGQGPLLLRLGIAAGIASVGGAFLLLWLPSAAFDLVVPILILLAVALVLAGPWLSRQLQARADGRAHWWLVPGVIAIGVYGGYFGAAIGVMLLAVLTLGTVQDLQRDNAAKNVLAAVVNGTAAIVFAFVADVEWAVAGVLALGALAGGQVGAALGRRIPEPLLRALIAVIGLAAALSFWV